MFADLDPNGDSIKKELRSRGDILMDHENVILEKQEYVIGVPELRVIEKILLSINNDFCDKVCLGLTSLQKIEDYLRENGYE